MQHIPHGKFVISLDFELLWGVRDKRDIDSYGSNIRAVHQVIPRLLEIFNEYDVAATFSTVGFLFLEGKQQLLANLPERLPNYVQQKLSPYNGHFQLLGESGLEDPYHYAPELIRLIKNESKHEIGTHTFSHYYCLEPGQTTEDFRADMQKAMDVAESFGIKIQSLVFPRNQFNREYLKVCSDLGIVCIRGNGRSWLYQARNAEDESLFRRALRLVDAYINISGHNCHSDIYCLSQSPIDIPASRFLRPYSPSLKLLDPLRLHRITSGMRFAAENNLLFHLWWHPHNFGDHTSENLSFLEKVLQEYRHLHGRYNFCSYTMSDLAVQLKSVNK